jgi:hypothetical protein
VSESLTHKAQQTLLYSKEREFSSKLREPFPEGLRVAEKGKSEVIDL